MDTSGGLPSASPTTLPATVTVENDFAPDMGTLRPETLLVLLTVHRYRDQGVGDGNWGAGDDMGGIIHWLTAGLPLLTPQALV